MNLSQAETLAIQLMQDHGLMASSWRPSPLYNWSFNWSRSKKYFGMCFGRSRVIELSRSLTECNNEVEVRDTILHEIAHALVGPGHSHNEVWMAKAAEIGARPEACYDAKTVVIPPGIYEATCGGCGRVFHKYRKPRTTRVCSPCYRAHQKDTSLPRSFFLVWHKTI